MNDITPAQIVPFVMALVCALAGALFARRGNDPRPYSLVAAILYAIALGLFILGVIAWGLQILK
jgi:tellurite resistance protein TehA-like permease